MPTHYLTPSSPTKVPLGRMLVFTATGVAAGTFQLRAVSTDGSPQRTATPKPGMLVVQPTSPMSVIIEGRRGEPFPAMAGADVQIVVGTGSDPDAIVVRMQRLDLGGLTERVLVHLDPGDAAVQIRSDNGDDGHEHRLTGLAALALADARRAIGSEQLGAEQAWGVSVVVDGSSSMRRWFENGVVDAAVQLIAGVTKAVTHDGTCQIGVVADRLAIEPTVSAGVIVGAVQRLREPMPWSHGAALAAITEVRPPAGKKKVTYVVTDGLPSGDRVVGLPPSVHLVPLVAPTAWAVLGRGWQAAASPLEPGTDLMDRLTAADQDRGAMIRALMAENYRRAAS